MLTLIIRIWALSLLISFSGLRAGIVWERTETEITPDENDALVEVPFAFKVAKDGQAVQILETGSSCGCTVPALDKRIYAPGEEGVLMAVFTPAGKQGKQSSRVTVRILEGGKETRATLSLTVNLPEWAKPETQRLEWSVGDTETKRLKIEVQPGVSLVLRSVTLPDAERFRASLVIAETGASYSLEASPVAKQPKGMTPVFVDVARDGQRLATLTIFLLSR